MYLPLMTGLSITPLITPEQVARFLVGGTPCMLKKLTQADMKLSTTKEYHSLCEKLGNSSPDV